MGHIDIDTVVNLSRIAATVLTMAALFVWARVGPGAFAAGLFTLLAVLAFESTTGWARSMDAASDAWVLAHRTRETRSQAAQLFADFGEPTYVGVVAGVAASLLAVHSRSAIRAAVLPGAVGVGVVIEETLKFVLHSFPSGHVTGAATLLGLIAVLVGRGRRLGTKALLGSLTTTGVVFVAGLAVYSGAHSVTDVLGGMVLGAAVVSLGVAVVNAVESRKRPAQPARVSPGRDVRSRVPVA